MHPALLYRPGERLATAELSAARLDGLLVEIDEAYMPADTVEGASARASALAPLLLPGTVFVGPSAAWILGAGDQAPREHHLQRLASSRFGLARPSRTVLHHTVIDSEDVAPIAGVAVTNALRTLVDLARLAYVHAEYPRWARAFALARPDIVPVAEAALRRLSRFPGKRRALSLLAELRAYDEVTR